MVFFGLALASANYFRSKAGLKKGHFKPLFDDVSQTFLGYGSLSSFFLYLFIDIPLLPNRQHVIGQPIKNQTGGKEEEHHPEDDRHDHHDLSLRRISGTRAKLHLNDHGCNHQQRKD